MTIEFAIDIVRETLVMSLITIAPLVLVGICVGLFISLAQSITSIQEQTLTFVPKLVAVCGAVIFFSNWLVIKVMDFTIMNFQRIQFVAP